MTAKIPQIVEILTRCPMFGALSAAEIKALASTAVLQEFAQGAVLFSEGERCEGFYVVGMGAVKVSKVAPSGREQVLHIIRAGESFAEVALFAGDDYPASAQVVEDTRLVFMRREPFLTALHANPQLTLRLMASISLWARRLADMVENLTLRDTRARLAAHLLGLANEELPGEAVQPGASIRLLTTKKTLAAQLSMTSETLSRTLNVLRDSGLIEERQGFLRLLDPDGLRQLVDSE